MTFWVFSSHKKRSPVCIRCRLPFPPISPCVQPQATSSFLSASLLDVSYKQDNTICVMFLLASFIWITVLKLNLWGAIYLYFIFIADINDIPLYGFITSNVSIYLSMDLCVVATFWLLSIMVLWIYVCKYLHGHVLFLLGTQQGVVYTQLLGHITTPCLTFLRNY